ncbi:PTK2 [Acanthosepion pharaonis]|uniref:PTK2 n=1 Tax=Acanthosepion pharaonis TaxID=158019 RepID=A0A812E9D3_ACAPH|nr:PTK2 [Sepia pharaonis]
MGLLPCLPCSPQSQIVSALRCQIAQWSKLWRLIQGSECDTCRDLPVELAPRESASQLDLELDYKVKRFLMERYILRVHLPNGGFNMVKYGDATDIKSLSLPSFLPSQFLLLLHVFSPSMLSISFYVLVPYSPSLFAVPVLLLLSLQCLFSSFSFCGACSPPSLFAVPVLLLLSLRCLSSCPPSSLCGACPPPLLPPLFAVPVLLLSSSSSSLCGACPPPPPLFAVPVLLLLSLLVPVPPLLLFAVPVLLLLSLRCLSSSSSLAVPVLLLLSFAGACPPPSLCGACPPPLFGCLSSSLSLRCLSSSSLCGACPPPLFACAVPVLLLSLRCLSSSSLCGACPPPLFAVPVLLLSLRCLSSFSLSLLSFTSLYPFYSTTIYLTFQIYSSIYHIHSDAKRC